MYIGLVLVDLIYYPAAGAMVAAAAFYIMTCFC